MAWVAYTALVAVGGAVTALYALMMASTFGRDVPRAVAVRVLLTVIYGLLGTVVAFAAVAVAPWSS